MSDGRCQTADVRIQMADGSFRWQRLSPRRLFQHRTFHGMEFPMRIRAALLASSLVLTGCGYNTIQTYDENVNNGKQQIEVQLQRRHDLIGNLVETVKGQAKQ